MYETCEIQIDGSESEQCCLSLRHTNKKMLAWVVVLEWLCESVVVLIDDVLREAGAGIA